MNPYHGDLGDVASVMEYVKGLRYLVVVRNDVVPGTVSNLAVFDLEDGVCVMGVVR